MYIPDLRYRPKVTLSFQSNKGQGMIRTVEVSNEHRITFIACALLLLQLLTTSIKKNNHNFEVDRFL